MRYKVTYIDWIEADTENDAISTIASVMNIALFENYAKAEPDPEEEDQFQ